MRTPSSPRRLSASWILSLRSLSRPFRRWLAPGRTTPILRRPLQLEALETRDLPSVVSPLYILARPYGPHGPTPLGSPGPVGYSPAQIVSAYGVNNISFNGVTGDGSGQTIAIVDAYNTPTISADLATFDATFGLAAPPSFKIVNQNGGNNLPANAAPHTWALETSLDVEWAHAVAPGANILLVESNTDNDSDMYAAVQYAATKGGASVVSMSWGESEMGGESANDGYFTQPGVTYVAASGDSGSPPIYPSASPNVLAVGGTSLTLSGNNYLSESAWSGSGGGLSAFEPTPSYQQGLAIFNGSSNGMRTTPDVSYNANPNTGVGVLDNYDYGGWVQVGGTSAAAPQWSGLIAITNQGRARLGFGSLSGAGQTLPDLYALPQSDFHDITAGSSISTSNPPGPNYAAGPGYDLATGRGTPMANLIVGGLLGPLAQVSYGGQVLPDNVGSVSLSAQVGQTAKATFTVENAGINALTLSDPINLPAGFSLVSDFGATSLAPGASTTFTVAMNTATVAKYHGTVSFGTSDQNNNPFSFTLTGTVSNIAIIDDSSASGFTATSGWIPYGGQGYLNNVHYVGAGNGSEVATWTFNVNVVPGLYDVAVTYSAQGNRATNAPYTVYDGSTSLGTVPVNQQLTPNDFSDQGVGWKDLGTFTINGNSLVVKLTNAANNYVIADAVRIQQVAPQATAAVFDGNTSIANGGSDSFGTTGIGTPVTKTFTVKNTGTATLTLSDPINVPAGFTLAADFGSTTVAPGSSTTFAVQLTAASAATYSGTVSFGTNDPNNATYSFTVSGTVVTPQATAALFDGNTSIANGGSDAFGTTPPGTPVTKTFTVKNTGTANLTLSALSVPPGYTIASNFGSPSVTPGSSTTFAVQLTAASAGTYTGSVSFTTNDPNNTTYSFTATGTVAVPPSTQIIDDSSASGFTATSGWIPYGGQGYKNNVHYVGAGSGSEVATWTFNVAPGTTYQVAVTYSAQGNRATNAPYTVYDASTSLGTVAVNQQLTPSDFIDQGVGWKTLGNFTPSGSTLVVKLTNAANGYVIADAVRIQSVTPQPVVAVFDGITGIANGGSDSFGSTPPGNPVTKTFTVKNTGTLPLTLTDPITVPAGFTLAADFGSTTVAPGSSTTFAVKLTAASAGNYSGLLSFDTNDPNNTTYSFTVSGKVAVPPTTQIIDDSSASGFTVTPGWILYGGQGYLNNVHYVGAGNGSEVATWTFSIVPGGKYDVAVTYSAQGNRATNAPYTVYDGGTSLGTIAVNQQLTPNDFSDQGVGWKDLGTFTISGNTLVVTLTNAANNYVIADAVRIQKVG